MGFGKHYGTCPHCKEQMIWIPATKSPRSKHYQGRCAKQVEVRHGYMCATAFDLEIDHVGVDVYPNLRQADEEHHQCALVKVEVRFAKQIRKEKQMRGVSVAQFTGMLLHSARLRLHQMQKYVERLEQESDRQPMDHKLAVAPKIGRNK